MGTFRGTVSGFAPRTESGVWRRRQTLVWSFRIERRDERGRPLPRIAVELRGKYFTGGSVNNGDVIEIDGHPRGDGVVNATSVRNLTARTTVRAHAWNASVVVVTLAFLLVLLAVVTGMAYLVFGDELPRLPRWLRDH